MNRAALRILAVALPVAGLAALWGWTHVRAKEGTEWEVPVRGYDPRDLLRGHYITYQYDWPGQESANGQSLCLEGAAPAISRVTLAPYVEGGESPCMHFVKGGTSSFGQPEGTQGGRLYVPQDKAAGLEARLRDPKQQGVVRIRLRKDGYITPLSISFRPRAAEQLSPDSPAA